MPAPPLDWEKWRNTLQQANASKGATRNYEAARSPNQQVRNRKRSRRGSACSETMEEIDLPPDANREVPAGLDATQDASSMSAAAATTVTTPPLSIWEFIAHEMNWGEASHWNSSRAPGVASVTAFLATPWHLEQFLLFGHALSVDLFLFHFTLLPLRIVKFFVSLVRQALSVIVPSSSGSGKQAAPIITRAALYDLVKVSIIIVATMILGMVQVSRVYHYIRGEAIIKLYVIFNILEILDKLCASIGADIIDSLHRTVKYGPEMDVLLVAACSRGQSSKPVLSSMHFKALGIFLLRVVFTIVYVTVHSCVIFVQIVCLNVALNSKNNSLLTLLVSNNFVELKASVFKKFEPQNLFQVSCADAVERFQLMLYLVLIALQEGVTESLLSSMIYMWSAELVVDWVKHSLFSKFNKLHADLYSTFSAILGHDAIVVRSRIQNSLDPTHACVRRIGLPALPMVCVVLRMLLSKVHPSWFPRLSSGYGLCAIALCVLALSCAKMLLSMSLLTASASIIKTQRLKQAAAQAAAAVEAKAFASPLTPTSWNTEKRKAAATPFAPATPLIQATHHALMAGNDMPGFYSLPRIYSEQVVMPHDLQAAFDS